MQRYYRSKARKGSDSNGSLSTSTSTVASKHPHSPYFFIPLAKVASPRLFSPPSMTVSAPSHSSCSRLMSASCCELTVPIPTVHSTPAEDAHTAGGEETNFSQQVHSSGDEAPLSSGDQGQPFLCGLASFPDLPTCTQTLYAKYTKNISHIMFVCEREGLETRLDAASLRGQ